MCKIRNLLLYLGGRAKVVVTTRLLKENPENPAYGPEPAFHYWSEPYFGYYLPAIFIAVFVYSL